ncbi:hypothetical protein ACA910_010758 [Epithemia clementina (nom. ined.)]
MKLTLVVALTFAFLADGFSPSTMKGRVSSSIDSAFPERPTDGWSDKPAYKPRSTIPVAKNKVGWIQRQMMDDVMIDPDYFLTVATALLCPLIIWYHPSYAADGSPSLIGLSGGLFHLLFAGLLWVQTRRVRCVFEKDAFEFYNIKGPHLDLERGAHLESKPANYVSGTRNRWKYDSITNWGFFPSEVFPVICYFKETETPEWKWNRWFAAFDSYGRGQPHFFPGICNVAQFKEQMESRGVKRESSSLPSVTPSTKTATARF